MSSFVCIIQGKLKDYASRWIGRSGLTFKYEVNDSNIKQAGAELCQAQHSLG